MCELDGTSIVSGSLAAAMSFDRNATSKSIARVLFMDDLGGEYDPSQCIALLMDDGTIQYSHIGRGLDTSSQAAITPYVY